MSLSKVGGDDVNTLDEEQRRLKRIMSGSEEGIISAAYVKSEDESKLEQAVTSANQACKEDGKLAEINKAIYTAAMLRDAPYTCVGRKFLRVAGVRSKMFAMYMRGLVLCHVETFKGD